LDFYVKTFQYYIRRVLYAVKVVATFYTVQYEHIDGDVAGCAHAFVLNSLRQDFAKKLQNRMTSDKDITKKIKR